MDSEVFGWQEAAFKEQALRMHKEPNHGVEKVEVEQRVMKSWHEEVFSCERKSKKSKGSRFYLLASYHQFWTKYLTIPEENRCYYELIPEGRPCKLYFDVEFEKQWNPGLDGIKALQLFLDLVYEDLEKTFGRKEEKRAHIDMSATTFSKFSHHLIFSPSFAFVNNVDMGLYVKHLILQLYIRFKPTANEGDENSCESPFRLLFPLNEQGEHRPIIDTAVYTKNRNFRLYLSSKMGKNAPFRRGALDTQSTNLESEKQQGYTGDKRKYDAEEEEVDVAQKNTICGEASLGASPKLSNTSSYSLSEGLYFLKSLVCYFPPSTLTSSLLSFSCQAIAIYASPSPNLSNFNAPVTLDGRELTKPSTKDNNTSFSESDHSSLESVAREYPTMKASAISTPAGVETQETTSNDEKLRNSHLSSSVHPLGSPVHVPHYLKIKVPGYMMPEVYQAGRTEEGHFRTARSGDLVDPQMLRKKESTGDGGTVESGVGGGSPFRELDEWVANEMGFHWPPRQDTSLYPHSRSTSSSLLPYEASHFVASSSRVNISAVIRSWRLAPQLATMTYNIGSTKWCEKIGREHKSNHIYVVVNLKRRFWFQSCHDQDCRSLPIPSVKRNIPPNIHLPGFSSAYDSILDDEVLNSFDPDSFVPGQKPTTYMNRSSQSTQHMAVASDYDAIVDDEALNEFDPDSFSSRPSTKSSNNSHLPIERISEVSTKIGEDSTKIESVSPPSNPDQRSEIAIPNQESSVGHPMHGPYGMDLDELLGQFDPDVVASLKRQTGS